ncbi:MAG: FIST N-terminal domain-containing protein, partial [bacterium]
MRHHVLHFQHGSWQVPADFKPDSFEVVFAFLDPEVARTTQAFAELKALLPNAQVVGCTTGGEIANG